MKTDSARTVRSEVVRAVTVPALIGATCGALAALVLPDRGQGDVLSSTPALRRI